jgi:hypothetical protein
MMTETNRPSLGSWTGWPWDAQTVFAKSLNFKLEGNNVQVFIDYQSLEESWRLSYQIKAMCRMVWASNPQVSGSIDIAQAVTDAIEAGKAKESAPAQPKKTAKGTASKKPAAAKPKKVTAKATAKATASKKKK